MQVGFWFGTQTPAVQACPDPHAEQLLPLKPQAVTLVVAAGTLTAGSFAFNDLTANAASTAINPPRASGGRLGAYYTTWPVAAAWPSDGGSTRDSPRGSGEVADLNHDHPGGAIGDQAHSEGLAQKQYAQGVSALLGSVLESLDQALLFLSQGTAVVGVALMPEHFPERSFRCEALLS